MILRFANKNDLVSIAKLSKDFEKEECCNGIKHDPENFFIDKNIVVVEINDSIIGYCYGNVEIKNRNTSFTKKGQKSFYIEEIYISPSFRNKEIGTKLFQFIEDYAKSLNCQLLETTAVSKDYKRLLNFYIDNNGMKFWSANLIKKL